MMLYCEKWGNCMGRPRFGSGSAEQGCDEFRTRKRTVLRIIGRIDTVSTSRRLFCPVKHRATSEPGGLEAMVDLVRLMPRLHEI